jgi:tRNA (cmo5U34)-methyltransferase
LSNPSDPLGHHDWHSTEYVDDWIAHDVMRDDERAPQLAALARRIPVDGSPVRVLDVGGGYGILTAAVLDEIPDATVVLHDFSEPMLAHAAERLAPYGDRVSYARADLRDLGWTDIVGDGFDAVVSSIAIHNVRDPAVVRQVFAGVLGVLRPGGVFLDQDLVRGGAPAPGSLADHLGWLVTAGFVDVDCAWRDGPMALLVGRRPTG